jgi:hypothetical protein
MTTTSACSRHYLGRASDSTHEVDSSNPPAVQVDMTFPTAARSCIMEPLSINCTKTAAPEHYHRHDQR